MTDWFWSGYVLRMSTNDRNTTTDIDLDDIAYWVREGVPARYGVRMAPTTAALAEALYTTPEALAPALAAAEKAGLIHAYGDEWAAGTNGW